MRFCDSESESCGVWVFPGLRCPGEWYCSQFAAIEADKPTQPGAGAADPTQVRAVDDRYALDQEWVAEVTECQYDQCAWRLGIDGISCPDDCMLSFTDTHVSNHSRKDSK